MSCGSLMIPKVPVSNHLADADGDFVAVAASAAVPSQPVSPYLLSNRRLVCLVSGCHVEQGGLTDTEWAV